MVREVHRMADIQPKNFNESKQIEKQKQNDDAAGCGATKSQI